MASESKSRLPGAALPWVGALFWLMAAAVASGTTGIDAGPFNFTAPIRGSAEATCAMSYQFISAGSAVAADSAQVVWSCTLNLPPDRYRTVGYTSIGGTLEFQLMSQDSVVAVGRAVTGAMRWGQAYTFTDTLSVPLLLAGTRLEPRWRLTCGGKPMGVISCGPVSRSEE